MNTIKKIDAQILRFFQFISDLCSALSGNKVNNFVLAHMCFITFVLMQIKLLVIFNIIAELKIIQFIVSIPIFVFINSFLFALILVGKKSCFSGGSGFKNKLEKLFIERVAVILVIMCLSSYEVFEHALYFLDKGPCPKMLQNIISYMRFYVSLNWVLMQCLIVFFLYFVACTPKPLSKNNIRNSLNRFSRPKIQPSY